MERRAVIKEWDGSRNCVIVDTTPDSDTVTIRYNDGMVHDVSDTYFWSIEVAPILYVDIIPHAVLNQGLIVSNTVIDRVRSKACADSAEVIVDCGCRFIRLTNPRAKWSVIRDLSTKVRGWDEFGTTPDWWI